MSISLVGTGAVATHTDTVTPALPAGIAVGQLAVLVVVSGSSTDAVPLTPYGWNLAGSDSGGGGTFGAAAGPRRVTYFTRTVASGDVAPQTSIPVGDTGSLIAGSVLAVSGTGTLGWRWAAAFGGDTASDTAFSAASATALTWSAGDYCVLGYGIADSTASIGSETLTATGVTFGTLTHQTNVAVADGNGARYGIATGSVSTGAAAQPPTIGATLSAASTGAAGVLRIREASGDVNASAQTVFPPRNLVSATGLAADDIVTCTLYRQVGGTQTIVRAADAVDVTGVSSLLRVDAEQPFNTSLNYASQMIDVNGVEWWAYSGPITSTVDAATHPYVLSDAITGLAATVVIETWKGMASSRDATVFHVDDQLITVSKPRPGARSSPKMRTDTDASFQDMKALLNKATRNIVQIRQAGAFADFDRYLAVLNDSLDPEWYGPWRWWTLDVAEAKPWSASLEARGFTLQDVANAFPGGTLQDVADFFGPSGTLLDIAQYDWGAG